MFEVKWRPDVKLIPVVDKATGVIIKDENGEIKKIEREPVLEGSVTLAVPSYAKRSKLLKQINSNKITEDDLSGVWDANEHLINFAKECIKEVALKRKEDGFVYKDIAYLEHDKDGCDALVEIGGYLAYGVKLGKTSGES